MKNNTYHIWNDSNKVIFRDEKDYIIFINKIAIFSHITNTLIIGYSVLSTHFHLIVKTTDLTKFNELLSKSYTKYFNNKYYCEGIIFNINNRVLVTINEVIIALNYVLKNALHHNLVEHPLSYRYSSVNQYFRREIYEKEYLEWIEQSLNVRKPSELNRKDFRKLFGRFDVPDSFQVINNVEIKPDSFISIKIVEGLYKNSRNFIYNINKGLSEEITYLEKSTLKKDIYINLNSSLSLGQKITDMDICLFIDKLINFPESKRSFKSIDDNELKIIYNHFMKIGVPKSALDRCV